MKRMMPVLLFVLCLCSAAAQEKPLTIMRFLNKTGQDSNSILANTTYGLLDMNVRYLGEYLLLPSPSYTIDMDRANLKNFADDTKSEYLIFGSLSSAADGTLVLEGNLYDRRLHKVFTSSEILHSVFEVFDASDKLALALLSELYHEKLDFGELTIAIVNGKGKYDVYINTILAASNKESIKKLTSGFKQIVVVGRSEPNEGKVLFSEKVMIAPGNETVITVDFSKKNASSFDEKTLAATLAKQEEEQKALEAEALDKYRNFLAKKIRVGVGFGPLLYTDGGSWMGRFNGEFDVLGQLEFSLTYDTENNNSLMFTYSLGGNSDSDSLGTKFINALPTSIYREMRTEMLFGFGRIFKPLPFMYIRPAFAAGILIEKVRASNSSSYSDKVQMFTMSPSIDFLFAYDKPFSFYVSLRNSFVPGSESAYYSTNGGETLYRYKYDYGVDTFSLRMGFRRRL